jgi:hypothetical protein
MTISITALIACASGVLVYMGIRKAVEARRIFNFHEEQD